MKLLSIIGTRPQYIKANVIYKLHKHPIIDTGQHYDDNMSGNLIRELGLRIKSRVINWVDYAVSILDLNSRLEHFDYLKINLDTIVLVYGDTDSTLSGALAAKKLGFKLAHIESGMRSFNNKMQEELNRRIVDEIADIRFTSTIRDLKEKENTYFVGDVMYDSALAYRDKKSPYFLNLGLVKGSYYLATIHRAEHTPLELKKIAKILSKLDKSVILPLHPRNNKSIFQLPNIKVIDPVGYFDMLQLIQNASMVLTDSGGVQKEAYFFKIPCLIIRNETEWTEIVELGGAKLAKSDGSLIKDLIHSTFKCDYPHIFGDGHAGKKILQLLKNIK